MDLSARAIAFGTCALFWWIWLSVWMTLVVSVAGSRSLDASPAAVLGGAAVAVTVAFAIGVFIMQLLFGAVRGYALAALAVLARNWRRIVKTVAVVVGAVALVIGILMGTALVLYAYAFVITSSISLTLAAAEQVEALALDYSVDAAIGLATAFARMFVAIAIIAASIAATYVGGRRLFRSPLTRRTA